MTDQKTAWSRRSFLQSALGTGAGFALTGPFAALGARAAGAAPGRVTGSGYGGSAG